MVCTYIGVVGLHEVNDHLGHRSGDDLLCTIANAARKFFVSSRILTAWAVTNSCSPPTCRPTAHGPPPTGCACSYGRRTARSRWASRTPTIRKLEAAVNKAEQAMQQDKLAYYSRNGQERQLKGLNNWSAP